MRGLTQKEMQREYLTPEREQELARDWRDNKSQRSLDRLVNAHYRLALREAYKICGKQTHPHFKDMVQEACIGLLECARRFDPDRGLRFSTYANWWMRAALQDYMMRNWSVVRGGTSAEQKQVYFAVRRLGIRHGSEYPETELLEISERTGIPIREVRVMYTRVQTGDSNFQDRLGGSEDGFTLGDVIPDPNPLPEELTIKSVDSEREHAVIGMALLALNPREQDIFRRRRLTDDVETLADLSVEYNVSRERIRQIEVRAMEKFKEEVHRLLPERAPELEPA